MEWDKDADAQYSSWYALSGVQVFFLLPWAMDKSPVSQAAGVYGAPGGPPAPWEVLRYVPGSQVIMDSVDQRKKEDICWKSMSWWLTSALREDLERPLEGQLDIRGSLRASLCMSMDSGWIKICTQKGGLLSPFAQLPTSHVSLCSMSFTFSGTTFPLCRACMLRGLIQTAEKHRGEDRDMRNWVGQGVGRRQRALWRMVICSELNKRKIFRGMFRRDSEVPQGKRGPPRTSVGAGRGKEWSSAPRERAVSGREGHLLWQELGFSIKKYRMNNSNLAEREINRTTSLSVISSQGSPGAKPNWQPGLGSPLS